MLFSEAIIKFNNWKYLGVKKTTIQGYDLSLRNLCIFLRDCEIEDIKLEQILEYLHWEVRMGFKANTLEKKVLAFREFFEFFKRQDYDVIDWRLIPMPRKEFVMPKVSNYEDYKKLLSVIPENSKYYWHSRNRAMINLLWTTGARLGEILGLDIPDLDLNKSQALIKTEKSKGAYPFRRIFWTNNTQNNLLRWLERREEMIKEIELKDIQAVFIGIKGGFLSKEMIGKRLALGAAGETLRKLSKKAGLKTTINAHSFRHAMGHRLAQRGANNSVISSILGHSNISSSYRYTQMFGTELENEYKKFIKNR